VKAEALAASQDIPVNFLENILGDLRRAGVVATLRGAEGGYRLARPASEITLADVIRPLDGPLAAVRGVRPEAVEYAAPTEHLQDVWVAVRASLRSVLEAVTVQDVATGRLPRKVARLTESEDAWAPH
jgi:Rrf2 family protein